MGNLEKYRTAFAEAFEIDEDKAITFKYKETKEWDSIGHMALIASLEDSFDIEIEPEDIVKIISFEAGIEILRNMGIEF